MDKNSHIAPVADLFWFAEENYSRSGKFFDTPSREKELIALLYGGWDDGLGRPMVSRMTPDEQAEAAKRLGVEYEALKGAPISAEAESIRIGGETISISPMEMLKVWESVHLDSKGRIRIPEYKAASCFRRGSVLLKVNTCRAKKGLEAINALPVAVKTWDTPLAQVVACVRENTLKTAGSQNLRDWDLVNACRVAFRFGATQAEYRRMFGIKEGMSQKYHRLCQLDAKYPNLHIADRIVSGELETRLFDKEVVKKVLDEALTEEAVTEWLSTPRANDPKIMAKKAIVGLADQCPVALVALTAKAILSNDAKLLARAIAKAEAVNKAVEVALNS